MTSIANNSLIGLDSMIFIYLFEEDERFIGKVRPLFEKIESGKLTAVTSIISLIETLSVSRLKDEPEKVIAFSRFFYETPNLEIVEVNKEIGLEAASLRREIKILRTPDSIQIATSISKNANFFITNDSRLQSLENLPLKILPIITL